uniref:Uncharacterized protein n=1 Tax=Fagus sylvatica TaxID=28930 RepID=A0A2N9IUC9_FAGSY
MADRCSCSSPHRAAQRLAKLRRASSLRPSSKIRARARGSLGPTAIQSRDLNTRSLGRSDRPRHASSGPDLGRQRERAETGSGAAEKES